MPPTPFAHQAAQDLRSFAAACVLPDQDNAYLLRLAAALTRYPVYQMPHDVRFLLNELAQQGCIPAEQMRPPHPVCFIEFTSSEDGPERLGRGHEFRAPRRLAMVADLRHPEASWIMDGVAVSALQEGQLLDVTGDLRQAAILVAPVDYIRGLPDRPVAVDWCPCASAVALALDDDEILFETIEQGPDSLGLSIGPTTGLVVGRFAHQAVDGLDLEEVMALICHDVSAELMAAVQLCALRHPWVAKAVTGSPGVFQIARADAVRVH